MKKTNHIFSRILLCNSYLHFLSCFHTYVALYKIHNIYTFIHLRRIHLGFFSFQSSLNYLHLSKDTHRKKKSLYIIQGKNISLICVYYHTVTLYYQVVIKHDTTSSNDTPLQQSILAALEEYGLQFWERSYQESWLYPTLKKITTK